MKKVIDTEIMVPRRASRTNQARRQVLGSLAAAAAGMAMGMKPLRAAEQWPSRPIKLIIAWPPGGGTDVVGRMVAKQLGEVLGQSIVVENRGGANAKIGTEAARHAAADGYTFLFHAEFELPSVNLNKPVGEKYLSYNHLRDLTPVGMIGRGPYIMISSIASNFRDLNSLVSYAKANPGKLNYGSYGAGSSNQFTAELMGLTMGFQATEIPYQGAAPLLAAMSAGDIHYSFVTPSQAISWIRDGRLYGLALLADQRFPGVDVPTAKELGLDNFTCSSLYGVFAPRGTPAPILEKMSAAIRKVTASPELSESLAKYYTFPFAGPSSPADMKHLLAQSLDSLRQVASYLDVELR